MSDRILTRREFLKLSSATLLGLLLADLQPKGTSAEGESQQGRVQATSLVVREVPAFSGKKVRSVKRDVLLDLAEKVYGGEAGDYNRHWYHLKDGGYVYSGWVQPLRVSTNPEVVELPTEGVLGEITIPFADSFYGINSSISAGPRLYYATTHWITNTVTDKRDGSLWYKAFDAATHFHYYIRQAWVHLFTPDELTPLSPQVPAEEKHIEIFLRQQILFAYEWDTLVYAARVATGRPGFESPLGWFHTFHKRPTYHMFGGADEFSIFDLPGVPWDSYLTDSGVAIHGTYWHNDFGTTHSHGCINMAPQDAKWIFRWSQPAVQPSENLILQPGKGTRVHIMRE
jgi:L,D-transpeptidase catalytic domain